MSLAPQLTEELRLMVRAISEGRHDLSLSGGRTAICFKGEDTEIQALARTCRAELPPTTVVIGTYHEPGICCLVL